MHGIMMNPIHFHDALLTHYIHFLFFIVTISLVFLKRKKMKTSKKSTRPRRPRRRPKKTINKPSTTSEAGRGFLSAPMFLSQTSALPLRLLGAVLVLLFFSG